MALGADKIYGWINPDYFVGRPPPDNWPSVTDALLDQYKSQGYDGFIFSFGRLGNGLGGANVLARDMTSAEMAAAVNDTFSPQRTQARIQQQNLVARLKARGFNVRLAWWASSVNADGTPAYWAPWFDDARWSNNVIPAIQTSAAYAKYMGADGFIFDMEDYAVAGGATARPNADVFGQVPGGTTEAAARAKIRQRGREMSAAMAAGYGTSPPPVTGAYFFYLPNGVRAYAAWVQAGSPGSLENYYANAFSIDWLMGMSEVPGNLSAFVAGDASFYKDNIIGSGLTDTSWDGGMQWGTNQNHSYLSRKLPATADLSKQHYSMFTWIDGPPGPGRPNESPRPLADVTRQTKAAYRWSGHGEWWDFMYLGWWEWPASGFSYNTYGPALIPASTPTQVDNQAPSISISTSSIAGSVRTLTGVAGDDFAIKHVKWVNATSGASGYAPMTWVRLSGTVDTTYVWRMDWSCTIPAAPTDAVTIAATDIHGLSTTLAVQGTVGPPPPGVSSAYDDMILAELGLQAYWKLDEAAAGTVADSKSAHHGSTVGGVAVGVAGISAGGTAFSFDGSTGYVGVNSDPAFDVGDGPFTVEAWVKRNSLGGTASHAIVGKGDNAFEFRLDGGTGKLQFNRMGVAALAESSAAITDTASFHHVVATKNGAATLLYIDGVDVTVPIAPNALSNTTAQLQIAASGRAGAPNDPAFLTIDAVAFYNVVLAPAKVASHYTAGTNPAGSATHSSTAVHTGDERFADQGTNTSTAVHSTGTTVSGASYDTIVLAETGLISFWKFDEASGNLLDYKGTNPGTTVSSGITRSATGIPSGGSAYNFKSFTTPPGYVRVPHATSLNVGDVFSIEFWIKRHTDQGTLQVVCSKDGASGGIVPAFYTDNKLYLFAGNLGSAGNSTIAITDTTTWHHCVLTKNGASGAKIYIDGTDVTTGTAARTFVNTTFDWVWGADLDGNNSLSDYLNGDLDNGALYSTVLSPAQVTSHYNAGLSAGGLTDSGLNTSVSTQSGPEAIAADGSHVAAVVHLGVETQVDATVVTSTAAHGGAETRADVGSDTTIATHTGTHSVVTPSTTGDSTSTATHTGVEARSEIGDVTAIAVHETGVGPPTPAPTVLAPTAATFGVSDRTADFGAHSTTATFGPGGTEGTF